MLWTRLSLTFPVKMIHYFGGNWLLFCSLFNDCLINIKHKSIHFSFSFPLKWNSRQKYPIWGKTHICHFFWTHQFDIDVVCHAQTLCHLFVFLQRTQRLLFLVVYGVFLATSHLSFTSISACPFSGVKGGSFFSLWTTLMFPVNGQTCDCQIYTKDRLPDNCSHEGRFMNSQQTCPHNEWC